MKYTIMKKLGSIIELIFYFRKTEILAAIETVIWLVFYEVFMNLVNGLEYDIFKLKVTVPLLFVVLPIIFAIAEYQKNETKIQRTIYILLN
jgi:hypothetical protein